MRTQIYIAAVVVAALVLVAWGILFVFGPLTPIGAGALRSISLDGATIHVAVAATDAERETGLGGRAGLAPDEGMLFVFQKDGRYAFWMKDMLFSIDMLWLSSDGRVVFMAQNVSPDTYPNAYVPTSSARYVLELPAGYAVSHGVKVGDTVQL